MICPILLLHWHNIERTALALSLLAALVFWASVAFPTYAGRWLIKWLAIASLAVIVWQQRRSAQELWLAAALLCHSAGDVLLDLDRTKLFLPAVAAFLCGHLLYIAAFWPNVIPVAPLSSGNKILIVVVIVVGLIMARILVPHLPKAMLVPISVYMAAISTMAIAAILADYPTRWVVAGVLLYLFSDALIGFTTFVRPLAFSVYLIWPAYYLGQVLIALGFLQKNAA